MPDNNPVNDQRISLFLRKLWTLVNSPDTNDVITWNEDGDSFIIKNQVDFCNILPRYFKHNNFMSFVRQLHIYGFSKRISDVDHTSNHGSSCEYAHPYFMKEHPYLLLSIKQKRGEKIQHGLKTDIDSIETISTLIKEVNSIKDKNKALDNKFLAMKHENECLWRELAVIRQKNIKQQRLLNQLIQFLVTLRQPGTNNSLCREVKNNVRYVLPIMHHKPPEKTNTSETFTNPKYKPSTSSGPVIHELDATDILNSNEIGISKEDILGDVVESEGVVLSPSSVSQMLKSPSSSTIEEIFAPNEILINSPLDELIREVSVSPTEELLSSEPNVVTIPSSNPIKKSTNLLKKKANKDINPAKKKKPMINYSVDKSKNVSSGVPYIIKMESMENDPPVISIPEMDFIEPEVVISDNDDFLNKRITQDSDNMQLAHPEHRQVITSAGSNPISLNLTNCTSEKEAVSKQVDTAQADLENLLKGLSDKYTFDANTFLNFINDDPTHLNLPMTSEEQTLNDARNELNVTPDNQIVSCSSPNTYDLNDLMTASADWTIPSTPISFDSLVESDVLNSPVINDSLLNSDSLFPVTTTHDNLKK